MVLLGVTDQIGAKLVMERLVENIRSLKIPNENAPTKPIVTLSIGLSTMYPNKVN
jgi:PleD family two-component response regulator